MIVQSSEGRERVPVIAKEDIRFRHSPVRFKQDGCEPLNWF